jgi:cyclic pyranopterin phosphate synthase
MSERIVNLPTAIPLQPEIVDRFQRPLRDLRISVMDRCNFRCPYCMPEDKYHKDFQFLDSSERLSFNEILRVARIFAGLGVDKLRITGGEPLLRPGLADLIGDLSRIDGIRDIALTTNGILLAQHAAALKAAGLDRVTVSLDSLDDQVFTTMSGGRGSKHRVLEGIAEAIQAGLRPIKINAVVKRGVNDHTALDLAEHFRGTGVIVRFIEYMDVGTINHWQQRETAIYSVSDGRCSRSSRIIMERSQIAINLTMARVRSVSFRQSARLSAVHARAQGFLLTGRFSPACFLRAARI